MSKSILYIAEIVTKAGVYCVKNQLQALKAKYSADFVIANADGASGGFGLGKNHSIYLHKLGIDVITSGDLIYNKKDIQEHLPKAYYLLRSANLPQTNPGRGWRTYSFSNAKREDANSEPAEKIVVINLLGQSGQNRIHPSNPFTLLPIILERARKEAKIIILDFHSSVTAEKACMNLYANGMLSAVIGSGMRVQTGDSRILSQNTAVISDTGRSGSIQSVAGFKPEIEIKKHLLGIPILSSDCWEGLELQGVHLLINENGKAESIEPFRHAVEAPSEDRS